MDRFRYASIKTRIETLGLLNPREREAFVYLMRELSKRQSLGVDENRALLKLLDLSEQRAKSAYPPKPYGRRG